MNTGGYIKIHRQLLQWEWFDHPEMVQLWIYLLLKANFQPSAFHGTLIPRGSLITSLATIQNDTGISPQKLRTCLSRLKSTNEITSKSTNKYTIITICKYEDYNLIDNITNKQINKQPNKQLTNKKESTKDIFKESKEREKETPLSGSKEKEVEPSFPSTPSNSLSLRKEKFRQVLIPYVGQYSKEMIREFFEYWSETNPSQTKMKFETQKTWELSKRLARWVRNEGKYTFRPTPTSDLSRRQRMEEAREIEQREQKRLRAEREKAKKEAVSYETYLAMKEAGAQITKPTTKTQPPC